MVMILDYVKVFSLPPLLIQSLGSLIIDDLPRHESRGRYCEDSSEGDSKEQGKSDLLSLQ